MTPPWFLCCIPSIGKSRGPRIAGPAPSIPELKLRDDTEIDVSRFSARSPGDSYPAFFPRVENGLSGPPLVKDISHHQESGSLRVDRSASHSDAPDDTSRWSLSRSSGPGDGFYPLTPRPPSCSTTSSFGGHVPHALPRSLTSYAPSDEFYISPDRGERQNRSVSADTGLSNSSSYGSSRPAFSMRTMSRVSQPRLYISIDIGAAFSKISYCADIRPGTREMTCWPGSENMNKIPTCLVYDAYGTVRAWGLEAKNMDLDKDWVRCEWFKSLLGPTTLPDGLHPFIPSGKDPITLVADFISCLLKHMRDHDILDDNRYSRKVCLTIPASWSIPQSILINKTFDLATSLAGYPDPSFWYSDFETITKSEAAAIYCAYMDTFPVEENRAFLICNAGAGTVELGGYIFLGGKELPMIAEACMRSGSNCGSLSLDARFHNLLHQLQKQNAINLDPSNLDGSMRAFAQFKLTYLGEGNGSDMVRFDCFDPTGNRAIGLVTDELAISRETLHLHVFEPVIREVLGLIESQLENMRDPEAVDALFLLGGFSNNGYLFSCVQKAFGDRIKIILRPEGADIAACRGAAQYADALETKYTTRVTPIHSTFATKSYILGVEIPAEPEDLRDQPTFISVNHENIEMCANRALYVVRKGEAIVRQDAIQLKFQKYSESFTDSLFSATLYISDSAEPSRYVIGGGEMEKFCRINVDLNKLPSFSENEGSGGPFHTDFESASSLASSLTAQV
ncbi:hypothetical protein BS47DRAFT_1383594 [Hydnum rufescens UP504]|uniref:Actin-like ATPase domain-containing protein n=1 Tax=Hydnum rufescens UP504 TaxID=1448309 RepID=A0A9P6ASL5_9AGAM|nr:hypothetical protein BS47DRAFT_1383594 [Hydnum rufescens UP504]